MNMFAFNAIAICLAASCALAQYQSAPAYSAGYQRKMAPSPQTYGQMSAYQQQQNHQAQQYNEQSQYEAAPVSYKAPSMSQYSDNSYAKHQQSSYAKPATSSYGQAASSYAKPAPRYEEPYYPPMPFAWGYDINDGYGGAQYHKENGDEYGKRTGSYGYTDAYGVYRQVDYVADEHGFRATIKTNEPGTANESPADVELHAYEPPSNYYAGSSANYNNNKAAPASYSAPKYSAPGARGYSPAAKAPRYQQSYEPAQQYSSSVIVPVYQKAANKRAY